MAGEMAGFEVERIISEPTAAAVAYGLYQQEKKDAKFLPLRFQVKNVNLFVKKYKTDLILKWSFGLQKINLNRKNILF